MLDIATYIMRKKY